MPNKVRPVAATPSPRDGQGGAWAARVASELTDISVDERRAALALLSRRLLCDNDANDDNGSSSSSKEQHFTMSPPPSPPADNRAANDRAAAAGGSRRGIWVALGVGLLLIGTMMRTASRTCDAAETLAGSSYRHAQHGPLGPSALDGTSAPAVPCSEPPPCDCPPAERVRGGRRRRGGRRDNGGGGGSSGGGEIALNGGNGGAFGNGMPRDGESYPHHGAFQHPQDALRWLRPARNTSDFPLLVCIGQGKTATKSLNKALVMLGFQTAHFYGAGIYGLLYDNAAEDQRHEFLFNVHEKRHVDAVLDTPVVEFYNEILLAYPKARIILTIREPRSWLKSQQKFYFGYARGCRNWLAPWRRGSNLVYGTECPTRAQALKRYVQHNRNVFDNVPRDRLLVMDIPGGDGWEKLVPFLNSFLPQRVPMPPSNMTFPSRH